MQNSLADNQAELVFLDFSKAFDKVRHQKGSLTVWALYAYFSDSQNAAFELLV